MKHEDLLQNIKHGQYDPVYLFVGEEEFFKEETLRLLVTRLVDPTTRDFNYDCLYGGAVEVASVLDIATSFPLMAERRLVVLRDVQHCSAKDGKALSSYAAHPCPTTCLVLVGPKLDLTKGFLRDISKMVPTVNFWSPFDNQIPAWVQRHVRGQKKRMTPGAVHLLQNAVGSNLQQLSNEIDKLITYCGERDIIAETDVEIVVGMTRTHSVFDLAGQLGRGEWSLSLQTLRRLLEEGESEVGIVWMLTRHYSTLAKMTRLAEERMNETEMARALKIRPFLVPSYLQQARRLTPASLEKAFLLLLETDTSLKSGQQDPGFAMEQLAFALCRLGSK